MSKKHGADPTKLVELLWQPSSASPRRGLTTEAITALAVQVADREGIEAVTIRRLADDANVSPMALYPHIGGRPELVELMLDRVAGSAYAETGEVKGPTWQARVRTIGETNWMLCTTHPWITALAPGRLVPGPGASGKYEIELHALDLIGLTDIEMDQVLTAILALTFNTARDAIAAERSRVADGNDDATWWHSIEPSIAEKITDPERFATAARVSTSVGEATGKATDPAGAFKLGLELLTRGIAARIAS